MIQKNKILEQIKKAVIEVDPTAEVILFGSQARGDVHEESDWDVLILTNQTKPSVEYKTNFYRKLYEVELRNNIVIGPLIRNRREWQSLKQTFLYKEIESQGQLI